MEVYAAQVTLMDKVIGEVIDHLRKSDQLENTLTFFTIDNGGCHVEYGANRKGDYLPEKTRDGRTMRPGNLTDLMPGPEITYQSYGYGWANLSNTPFRLFKQYDHEGGIHTPMIAHWPKGIRNSGSVCGTLSHLVDLMPTILEASKVKPTEQSGGAQRIAWDGRSILPPCSERSKAIPKCYFFTMPGEKPSEWEVGNSFSTRMEKSRRSGNSTTCRKIPMRPMIWPSGNRKGSDGWLFFGRNERAAKATEPSKESIRGRHLNPAANQDR